MGTYQLKDVADATFYDLTTGKPILYLDNLKLGDTKIEHTPSAFEDGFEAKIIVDSAEIDKGQLSLLLGRNILD